jgi:endogenous inhibitor of DNA gyrase (YacG/DUF329 family)
MKAENNNMKQKLSKCPECKKPIESVRVYSECYQIAMLDGLKITDYGPLEEITETIAIECPECSQDIINFIEQ